MLGRCLPSDLTARQAKNTLAILPNGLVVYTVQSRLGWQTQHVCHSCSAFGLMYFEQVLERVASLPEEIFHSSSWSSNIVCYGNYSWSFLERDHSRVHLLIIQCSHHKELASNLTNHFSTPLSPIMPTIQIQKSPSPQASLPLTHRCRQILCPSILGSTNDSPWILTSLHQKMHFRCCACGCSNTDARFPRCEDCKHMQCDSTLLCVEVLWPGLAKRVRERKMRAEERERERRVKVEGEGEGAS